MSISHAGHNHPATPAARATCRKLMEGSGGTPTKQRIEAGGQVRKAKAPSAATKAAIVADNATANASGKLSKKALKTPGTVLRRVADMGDVPAVMAPLVRLTWERDDWVAMIGKRFDDEQRHVYVGTPHGQITLVWSTTNPNGLHKVWWRPLNTSLTYPATVNQAIRLGEGAKLDD